MQRKPLKNPMKGGCGLAGHRWLEEKQGAWIQKVYNQ